MPPAVQSALLAATVVLLLLGVSLGLVARWRAARRAVPPPAPPLVLAVGPLLPLPGSPAPLPMGPALPLPGMPAPFPLGPMLPLPGFPLPVLLERTETA